MYQIKKRSGELELFELSKIKSAIKRTFDSCNRNYQESIIETISIKSVADAETKIKDNVLNVEDIQDSVEKVLMTYGYEDVAKAYILYRKQHERVRNAKETVLDYKKTVDSYLKADDWRVKENASIDYSLGGLILGNSGAITANYWLSEIYDEEIANAHRNCDIHIHDLSMLSAYCNGGSLKQLIKEGLGGVPKKISSKPASHLSTLCNQIVNFLGILSLEFAGAQALSSVDTLLAPFVKSDSLSYNEVKQCIQSLVFGLNTPSRWGGQPVFSNFTIDWTVPDDLAEMNCIVGGKEVDFKYKDCKREMDMINKAFLEVMIDGDADGRSFSYPILTYSITKDFDWDTESINNKLLFEMTAKYGIPYFSNYINSDMNPSDTRSMAILGTQNVIYKDKFGRISKNEIRHLVKQWIKTPETQYSIMMNGKFVDIIDMFEVPYEKYDTYIRVNLANGQSQSFSYDHKCVILRDGNIIEDYSQNIVEGDNFLLAKHPYNESEIGSYESGKIVGYYLAEGWKLHNGAEINFAININRDDICKDIISFFNDNFGCRVSVDVDAERHCRKVKVFSKAACEFVSSFIDGDRATEKHIKTSCFDTSSAFRQGIFDGYLETDGCKSEKIFAHTTNKKLCFDMIELFATIGKYFKFRTNDKNTRYFKPDKSDLVTFTSYELKLYEPNSYDDDYFYIPIKSIESVDAKRINTVYNFTVNTSDHLYELPNGIITHQCCRLRLDLRELRRKNGGYFGSGDGTGSIGVTTINMPRLAYLSKDEDDFYKRLDNLMDICSRSLEIKRDVVSKLLQDGLYPYTKRYVKNFNNHFSTIATHGMNEMCLNANWIKDNIASEKGYKFAKDVLDHMRNRLSDYQEKTGNLYNLESAPAESTCVVENDYIMTTKGNISVKSILNMSESERSELGIMSVNLEDKKLEVKHLKDIWKTRENAQCLKIYFDNGDSIIVTPNHKIAKRFTSGNKSSRLNWIDYVRADELKENDRLVALNKSSPLGDYVDYTVGLGTPCGKKLTFSEHNLFGEFYYGKKPEGYVFHHIDENKKNNTKSNLVMMSSTDHKRLHGKKDGYKYLPTGSGQDNNFYGKHHTEESRKKMGVRSDSENFESWYKNMCASCRSDEHRRKLSEIAKNKPSEKHSKYRHDCDTDKILELWYNGMTVSEISKTLGGNYTYSLVKSRLKISGITPNHKIVKIEKLEETFDVYDLEVEDNHNFFVSGCAEKMGVLVHNCLRFAMHDKKDFPDIITAGDKTEGAPYYTNSSNLPVGYTDDIFEALDHQDELQTRYTGGTVFHAFLGEKLPSWQAAMNLTRKIAENYRLPYFTFSPTYSICPEHGYLVGEQWKCPHCGKDTEVYSRVTGYYRAVQNFNDGKAHEFKDRKEYTNFSREFKSTQVQTAEETTEVEDIKLERPILFTTSNCPNCKIVKQLLAEYDFVYDLVVADQDMETARKFDINQAPTLVVQDEEGNLIKIANVSNIKKFIEEAMADIDE